MSTDLNDYAMPTVDELIEAEALGSAQYEQFRAAAEVRFDLRNGFRFEHPVLHCC
jgi:hypothetical protein